MITHDIFFHDGEKVKLLILVVAKQKKHFVEIHALVFPKYMYTQQTHNVTEMLSQHCLNVCKQTLKALIHYHVRIWYLRH